MRRPGRTHDVLVLVYRSMKEDPDGLPLVAKTSSGLGVRVGYDVVLDDSGDVLPGLGGVSVMLSVAYLPRSRRPPRLGGIARETDEVWQLEEDDLDGALVVRPDDEDPDRHAFIEPRDLMPIDEYERLLWESRASWRKVP
jgi:hypothetical protein